MGRLYRLLEKVKEDYEVVIDLMETFDESPSQAGRNEIIRKMAVFNRDKNHYMAQLKNVVLRGNEKVNLKNVYNYNKSRKVK